jgi:hypothetical protein
MRNAVESGVPITIVAAVAPSLVIAGFIWLPVPVVSGELACLIALPLVLLAGALIAWAGRKWTWQFRLRTLRPTLVRRARRSSAMPCVGRHSGNRRRI